MTGGVKCTNCHWVLIDITDTRSNAAMSPIDISECEHFAEVCVRFNGEEREFELLEFARLLGFGEES